MSLKFTDRGHRGGYRAAVVVSRKVHKSAVKRNRIRRRVYEIIRHAQPKLIDNKDLVLTIFSDQTTTVPAADLQKAVEDLLKKAATALPAASEHR